MGVSGLSPRPGKKSLNTRVPHLPDAAEGISSTSGYRPPI
jgi:hypothetical protein